MLFSKANITKKMNDQNINQKEIRDELISIFRSFLEDPNSDEVQNKSILMDKKYSGLIGYAEHASKQIVSANLLKGLNILSTLNMYGKFEDSHPAFSKDKIITTVKEIVEKLKIA